jgi:hypothetical protein
MYKYSEVPLYRVQATGYWLYSYFLIMIKPLDVWCVSSAIR